MCLKKTKNKTEDGQNMAEENLNSTHKKFERNRYHDFTSTTTSRSSNISFMSVLFIKL